MKFTIAIQCHFFQRRLCWMLSSLLQQTRLDLFGVDVAHMRHNGCPQTEDVIHYFSGLGLHVWSREYTDYAAFQQRGLTRNDQLRECLGDWIWFADCDHVYHPQFIERLDTEIDRYAGETRLVTAGRMSMDPDPPLHWPEKPEVVASAFEKANAVEPKYRRSAPGAGHTQIVRVANLPDRVYVDPAECRDHKWSEKGTKARSDQQFRSKVGGKVTLPDWYTFNQLHLNHRRDSDAGYHLEEQR